LGRRYIRKKGSYRAVDANGREHTIEVFATVMEIDTLESSQAETMEVSEAHKMAANGNHVNVEEDGSLVEAATGRTMRRK
jgi:hypothetical protein